MPRVLNKYKDTIPDDAIWVMRPSKWSNPFVVGKDGNREEVVTYYAHWILEQPHLMASLHEIRGRDLVCCCAPLLCHADILLEIANEEF